MKALQNRANKQREIKWFTRDQLLHACDIATRRNYNRQLDTDRVRKETDADDLFPVVLAIPHEHAQGVRVPTHVRCMVYINTIPAFIDTDIDLFSKLGRH